MRGRRHYSAALVLALALPACAGRSRVPAWFTQGYGNGYAPPRYLVGVGAAPILRDDIGAALEAAEARARAQIARVVASEVRARSEAVAQEWRSWGTREGNSGLEIVADEAQILSRTELKQAKRVEQFVDRSAATVYAMVALDLDALADTARQDLAVYDHVQLTLARAANPELPLGTRIQDLVAVLDRWPPLPESVAFLASVDPPRAAALRSLLPQPESVVTQLRQLLSEVRINLTPPANVRRGEPVEIVLNHNAPGLAVATVASGSQMAAAPTMLDEGPQSLRLARVYAANAEGTATITLSARDAARWVGQDTARLATLVLQVDGPPARLYMHVQDDGCGLDTTARAALTATCAADFVRVDQPPADRSINVTLTCTRRQQDQRGYSYILLDAVAQVDDDWAGGRRELRASGAGPDAAAATQALAAILAPRLCAAKQP